MNRTEKLKLNSKMSLINKIAVLISGLILPRFILGAYGSEVNGLVNSITQFLSVITFLDLGVGRVVQSALYKPLVNEDNEKISQVLSAAKRYFRIIAYILIIYITFLIVLYPRLVDTEVLNSWSTIALILSLSISFFSRYYFGIVNELLLNANQRSYVQLTSETTVIILNLLASLILIYLNQPIYIVKFVAGLIYLIRPIYLTHYVNQNYDINYNINDDGVDSLPQKWNGMGQHIAFSIQNSTDIVVLTIFSSLENVSIYGVYNMVANTINSIVSTLVAELTAFFGNLLAEEDFELLLKYFNRIEWILHTGITFVYGMCLVLITYFVQFYTSNVNDINYYAPIFAVFLIIGKILTSLKSIYQSLVFADGQYKQTQVSSFIEAGINIIVSILLVNKYGLIGVAIGSCIGVGYRVVYLVLFLENNILQRKSAIFYKQIIIDFITILVFNVSFYPIKHYLNIESFLDLIIVAILLSVVFIIQIFIINLVVYPKHINFLYKHLIQKV